MTPIVPGQINGMTGVGGMVNKPGPEELNAGGKEVPLCYGGGNEILFLKDNVGLAPIILRRRLVSEDDISRGSASQSQGTCLFKRVHQSADR